MGKPSQPSELRFVVAGFPPAKNEALSMLGTKHPHASRVRALLEAARTASGPDFVLLEGPLGLEVELHTPSERDPWDATNYLGGIGDALEAKGRRGKLDHLGKLAEVGLYTNDRQIREIRYRQVEANAAEYTVRLWRLDSDKGHPLADQTRTSYEKDLKARIGAVFHSHPEQLADHRKSYPWLTGSLGSPHAGIFFVAEIPSASAVEGAHGHGDGSPDPAVRVASMEDLPSLFGADKPSLLTPRPQAHRAMPALSLLRVVSTTVSTGNMRYVDVGPSDREQARDRNVPFLFRAESLG